jgi:hypothetical protein
MKSFARIGIVYHDFQERGVIDEFRDLFPFGQCGAGFRVELPPEDPQIRTVLHAFAERGIPRTDCTKKERPKVEYTYDLHRTYDTEDFAAAEYLDLRLEVLVSEDQERDAQGRLQLHARQLRPSLRLGCVLFNALVVSEALRQAMLQAGLIGPRFAELIVLGPQGPQVSRGFWELVSSVILPPMPRERVVVRKEAPEDYVNVAGIRDGEFADREIHYAEAAIRRIEPFDFALTHEVFGGERWPVVSQRFRQFALAQKLKVSWVPVRLDPT